MAGSPIDDFAAVLLGRSMRFQMHFDLVRQASNIQGGRAVMRNRAASMAAPTHKMVVCLLAAVFLHLAPGPTRAAETAVVAGQDAPSESESNALVQNHDRERCRRCSESSATG